MTGQPDPSVSDSGPATAAAAPATDGGGRSPVTALNELLQAGVLRDLDWGFTASGPPHDPEFTCTVTARRSRESQPLTVGDAAKSKKEAKSAAARRLYEMVTAGERT